jgi:hypothetical protein
MAGTTREVGSDSNELTPSYDFRLPHPSDMAVMDDLVEEVFTLSHGSNRQLLSTFL